MSSCIAMIEHGNSLAWRAEGCRGDRHRGRGIVSRMPGGAKSGPSEPAPVQPEPGVGIGTRGDRSDNPNSCAGFDRHWSTTRTRSWRKGPNSAGTDPHHQRDHVGHRPDHGPSGHRPLGHLLRCSCSSRSCRKARTIPRCPTWPDTPPSKSILSTSLGEQRNLSAQEIIAGGHNLQLALLDRSSDDWRGLAKQCCLKSWRWRRWRRRGRDPAMAPRRKLRRARSAFAASSAGCLGQLWQAQTASAWAEMSSGFMYLPLSASRHKLRLRPLASLLLQPQADFLAATARPAEGCYCSRCLRASGDLTEWPGAPRRCPCLPEQRTHSCR